MIELMMNMQYIVLNRIITIFVCVCVCLFLCRKRERELKVLYQFRDVVCATVANGVHFVITLPTYDIHILGEKSKENINFGIYIAIAEEKH